MSELHVMDHPLVRHKLSIMRDKETGSKDFRELLEEVSMLMGYEVTRNLPTKKVTVQTPITTGEFDMLAEENITIVPILRAGLGMTTGLQKLVPFAKVGHIGLFRDPETLEPIEYYCKMPDDVAASTVIIVDPMLATGGSSSAAIGFLKKRGCNNIRLMCLIAAPEGVAVVQNDHPDVDIYVAQLDESLNEHAYIVPGLGDAGDRIFGTK
ncbi:MAG: uracil phosphoribosyltransferase [Actinobacteria bacterium]|nr:uracil phosphoribosyltransferase [Actinomycetota bacterium]